MKAESSVERNFATDLPVKALATSNWRCLDQKPAEQRQAHNFAWNDKVNVSEWNSEPWPRGGLNE